MMPIFPADVLQRTADADGIEALLAIREEASAMLEKEVPTDDPADFNRRINLLHDVLIGRTVQLAEREMENRGKGLPPVSYAFVLFGSGGRAEQTLWSDQDNGIVYADSEGNDNGRTDSYFAELGQRCAGLLELLGYPYCDGNVSCRSGMWCRSLSGYLDMVDNWLAQPNWENVRNALIAADMRGVYGDIGLVSFIRQRMRETIAANPGLLQMLLANTFHRKIALGVFGQLITERYGEAAGGMDLKYGAYIPLVNAVRLLAIKTGISVTSTLERLDKLALLDAVPVELAEDWREAFLTCLRMRRMVRVSKVNGIYTSSGKLFAEQLTPAVRKELKYCLHAGERLQRFVRHQVEKAGRL